MVDGSNDPGVVKMSSISVPIFHINYVHTITKFFNICLKVAPQVTLNICYSINVKVAENDIPWQMVKYDRS